MPISRVIDFDVAGVQDNICVGVGKYGFVSVDVSVHVHSPVSIDTIFSVSLYGCVGVSLYDDFGVSI